MNHNYNSNLTVGEIVKHNYKSAGVFKKYNIDFCCGGNKTITEVCSENNISIDELTSALAESANQSHDTIHKYNDWETDFLVKYIIKVHHKYVKENIPHIIELTKKIVDVHGVHHPELIKVAEYFGEISRELEHHLMKEEQILFPYILELHYSVEKNLQPEPAPFGTVRNPIAMMIAEHENAGNLLKEIRAITNDFTLPDDACNTYTVTFKNLDEFENDLHLHIHLENNILFPRAVKLEEGISGADNE